MIPAALEDPEVEKKKAAKALGRFMRMHAHNIAQKTEVIIEHFRHSVRHRIGGRAKAMVVTGSRLEAVRYKKAFDLYIAEKKYGFRTLVAFSGSLVDPDDPTEEELTEVKMNGGKISEKQPPAEFAKDGCDILIVAEEYQTVSISPYCTRCTSINGSMASGPCRLFPASTACAQARKKLLYSIS